MKSVRTSSFVCIALFTFGANVTARPFADSTSLVVKDYSPSSSLSHAEKVNDERFKRDNGGVDSEIMINTPLATDDDEPIKRDNGGLDPEVMVNTPILEETGKTRRRDINDPGSEALINTPELDDFGRPRRRDSSNPDVEAMINTPTPVTFDDDEPIKRDAIEDRSDPKQTKRGIPGVNSLNYFGNDYIEKEADGSDDLFQGIAGGKPIMIYCFAFQRNNVSYTDTVFLIRAAPILGY